MNIRPRWKQPLTRRKQTPCQRLGHDVPRTISADTHPEVVSLTHSPAGIAGQCGVARPIACKRCGVLIGPMDAGYPLIMPSRQPAPNVGTPPIALISIEHESPLTPEEAAT